MSCTQRNGVIIGYSVQYNEEGEAPLTVNASGVTSIVIAGLTEFRMYFIRVAAINNNGIGPYSNASNFYTGKTNYIFYIYWNVIIFLRTSVKKNSSVDVLKK